MNPKRQSLRAALLLTLLSVVLALYCLRLMQMQVVDGEKIMAEIERGSTTEQVIKAARGEILDRNGRPLASNTIGRDVVINQAYMERGTTNQTILRLIGIMEEANEDWIDNLPITEQEPFAFKEGDVYEASIARLKDALGVAQYATVDDVMSHLIENYGLEDLSPLDARRVAGVRYEMINAVFPRRSPIRSPRISRSKRFRKSRNEALKFRASMLWKAPSASTWRATWRRIWLGRPARFTSRSGTRLKR